MYVFTRLNKVYDAMPTSKSHTNKLFPRPPTPFDGKPSHMVCDALSPLCNVPSLLSLSVCKQEPVTCDLWPVTCDMWHVTCELWTVTCDLNKNQSWRNCVGDFWHLPNSDHVRMRGLIEREQKKWNNVLATCEKSASLVPVCVQVWQRMNLIIWPVIDFLHRPSHGDDGSCHDTGSRTRSGDVCDGELR